jgi:uncharacterized iron-regulated membrane protein
MSKKSRSKLWFLVHSWLALPIWFFVLIVCVTGTLAVVSQEIVWLATPEMPAPASHRTMRELLTYDQVLAAIQAGRAKGPLSSPSAAPTNRTLRSTWPSAVPRRPLPSLSTSTPTPGHPGHQPQLSTSRPVHPRPARLVAGAVYQWLQLGLVPGVVPRPAVAGLADHRTGGLQEILERAFSNPTLRFKHGARIFWGDFHRLCGIWSIWFIAVISITGLWF